jgi:hypothetical protein
MILSSISRLAVRNAESVTIFGEGRGMPSVNSSNISWLDYDPELQELTIRFHSGGTYTYSNVSEEEYQALLNAPSIGQHFHQYIKNEKPVR